MRNKGIEKSRGREFTQCNHIERRNRSRCLVTGHADVHVQGHNIALDLNNDHEVWLMYAVLGSLWPCPYGPIIVLAPVSPVS